MRFILTLSVVVSALASARSQETLIRVQADRVLGDVSRHLTGACIEDVNHEIYGGLYSQMIFGESFQEPAAEAPIAGFKYFGGTWTVRDAALHMTAPMGPSSCPITARLPMVQPVSKSSLPIARATTRG